MFRDSVYFSSVTQTMTSQPQPYPSGSSVPILPATSNNTSTQSGGRAYNSSQPQPTFSSVTQTAASQPYPSGSPVPSDSVSHGHHDYKTKLDHCYSSPAMPTVTASLQQSSGGILPSDASVDCNPTFTIESSMPDPYCHTKRAPPWPFCSYHCKLPATF